MKIQRSWLLNIRDFWVAGFSLFFFLNLDQFGIASGLGPAPKYWIVGTFLVTAILFLPDLKPMALLRKPIVWWTAIYLLISIIWMAWAHNQESASEGLTLVITTALLVGTAAIAYPRIKCNSFLWDITLWLALLVAVASIVLEYFSPSAFLFAEAGQGITGRSAGLYLNPNIAGQALLMILACILVRSSPRVSLIAAGITLTGLLLTFSRGGLIGWLALVTFATVLGRLPRWFLLVITGAAAITLAAGPLVFDMLSVIISPENRNSLDRIAWLLGQGQLGDYSSNERKYLVGYAWQDYLRAPILGHGLGYMWAWAAGLGTHNMILRHLVEYGMLGVLILPSFLVLAVRSSPRGTDRRWLWMAIAVVLMLSMFTHNMLEGASFMLPFLFLNLAPISENRNVDMANFHHQGKPDAAL